MIHKVFRNSGLNKGLTQSSSTVSPLQCLSRIAVVIALLAAVTVPASSQTDWDVQTYFKQVGLTRTRSMASPKAGRQLP